jgi:hypothetical protein
MAVQAVHEELLRPEGWEAAALAAGVEPGHVWKRRELQIALVDAAAELMNGVELGTAFLTAALERHEDEAELAAQIEQAEPFKALVATFQRLSLEAVRICDGPIPYSEAQN